MTNNRHRLPAEWQHKSAVLLSWPHAQSDWAYMLEEVTDCYRRVASALSRVATLVIVAPDAALVAEALEGHVAPDRLTTIQMPTNDTWARDFGFISTTADGREWRLNDFTFNGWGLKFPACHDNQINRRLAEAGVLNASGIYVNKLGFVLEGGSIDVDGCGTMLTTAECLLSPNRNGEMTREQIDAELRSTLGQDKVIWIEHGALAGDDTDSHIDTLARFLPGGVIAYSSCDRDDDEHYAELQKMEEELAAATDTDGKPYRLTALPIPHAIYDESGLRLPATYANFLIINGTIFLPVYGDEHYDAMAAERLAAAAPGYTVVPVDCRTLIHQHGSLHCITMQLPEAVLRQL